jgi:PTH1 family peptidyl-tRNA hydrolase
VNKFLIVGLGNPGPEYEVTRHNAGFLILDRLAEQHKVEFEPARYGDKAEFRFKGKTFHLVKPATYMNLSGRAVQYWLNELKTPLENLVVVVDDIALPFGNLRLRPGGSSAGHNGLQNIQETLGTPNYARLRFGIGNHFARGRQVDYVLSPFTQDEFRALPERMDRAGQMLIHFALEGCERTMNAFND